MITVELETGELERVLGQLSAGLSDNSLLMNELGNYLLASTQDRVQRGEQPDGQPFAPRSQTTIELYARQGKSYGAPLNQSGRMRQQIAFNYGPDWMEIGSNAIQAAVMQFGADKHSLGPSSPWGDVTARPFLGLSEEDRVQMFDIVVDWLNTLAMER